MSRMTMNTFEIEKSTVAFCSKCGFGAAASMLTNGVCSGCIIMAGQKKWDMSNPRGDGMVHRKTLQNRCYDRLGKYPTWVKELINGRENIPEIELPPVLKWRPPHRFTGQEMSKKEIERRKRNRSRKSRAKTPESDVSLTGGAQQSEFGDAANGN